RRHTRFSRDWSSDVCSSDLGARRATLPTYPFTREPYWFARRAAASATEPADGGAAPASLLPSGAPAPQQPSPAMSRIPAIEAELQRILSDVSGIPAEEIAPEASFVDQGLDSLSLTQATLDIEQVFGVKLRFRRLLEDLDNCHKLAALLDAEMAPERFAPPAAPVTAAVAAAPAPAAQVFAAPLAPTALSPLAAPAPPGSALQQLIQQQMQ